MIIISCQWLLLTAWLFWNFQNLQSNTFVPKPFKGHLMRTIYGDGTDIWLGRKLFTYALSIWTTAHHLIFSIILYDLRESMTKSKLSTEVLMTAEFGIRKKISWEFSLSFPQKPWMIILPVSAQFALWWFNWIPRPWNIPAFKNNFLPFLPSVKTPFFNTADLIQGKANRWS